jgi:outer membrane protein OmpA-like peptidoglycan-associated protein
MRKIAGHISVWGIWLTLVMLFHACAGGLFTNGYETYLDVNGDVVRAYLAPYSLTLEAGVEALADIGGTVASQRIEEHETIVQAQAPDGAPMRILFVKEGRNLTVVRVRTGRGGLMNHEYSNQLHVYLAQRLKPSGQRASSPTELIESGEAATEDALAVTTTPKATVKSTPGAKAQTSTQLQRKAPPPAEIARPEAPAGTRPQAAPTETSAPTDADRDAPAEVAKLTDLEQPRPDYVIFFEKDSNIPPLEAMATLNQVSRRIQANPDILIAISGYADPDEDPAQLHLVSESRTLAVKSYLIGRGIASSRIRTAWHGSRFADPALEDKSQQRRVEIRLHRGL